ncbi:thermonuclease family protein [Rhizobium sp. TRM95111]|uniref:thermonuclease family protein n=1 Tax=Rhizobium alarense TaxID=2846851 RepID=UPI001F1D2B67|nr:thermonuclease family protein [Rhizobium alarense]MCF3639903.1 thermonuclease family protein [Rhizobium alarense]
MRKTGRNPSRFSLLRDIVTTVAIVFLLALVVLRIGDGSVDVAGRGRAADGDTLTLDGRRIRLKGLDAPEYAQTCRRGGESWNCGAAARARLAELMRVREIVCRTHGHDRYGRLLARCAVGGEDLGARMVREGMAVSYGDYTQEEALAQAERRGLWGGSFDRPQDWRRRNDRPPEEPHDGAAGLVGWLGALLRS